MGMTRPTTCLEQPRRSSFNISAGNAASDEDVPSTTSNSSRIYRRKRRMLKPAIQLTRPSTNSTNKRHVR